MTPTFYTITAQTNLHVGSGDANYGIIDKLVQRDALTQFPVIHASSLKGAILQHFFNQDPAVVTDEYIDAVFGGQTSGSKRRSGKGRPESKTGEFIFLQANLLSIPVRCKEHIFMRVSSSRILKDLAEQLAVIGVNKTTIALLDKIVQKDAQKGLVFEGKYSKTIKLEDKEFRENDIEILDANELQLVKKLLGDDRVIILPDTQFKELVSDHYLPVIARNHLENGQSTNLWYEQILPRQTRFGFAVLKPENHTQAASFDLILTDEGMVQIGANASVGYGFCKIDSVTL